VGNDVRMERRRRADSFGAQDRTDADLIAAARAGDALSLTTLFRRHDPKLRSFVHGLMNTSRDLDDVMQDVYLKAFRSLDSYRGEAGIATWLHRIAYNAVVDAGRRRPQHDVHDDEALNREPQKGSLIDEQATARLDASSALAKLSSQQRAALLMIDGHGFSYRDVAAVLGISEGTVGAHLIRGRAAFKSALNGSSSQTSERGASRPPDLKDPQKKESGHD